MPRPAKLLDATYTLLESEESNRGLPAIAREAGVGYEWLKKFSRRAISDPTVRRVQKLHDYLQSIKADAA